MKVFKKLMCVALVLMLLCGVCACGANGSDSSSSDVDVEESTESAVRSAVETRGMIARLGMTIGGNELKSSRVTITNMKKLSDTEYRVSGKIVMTDVYGTDWNNTFDCEVEYTGSKWSAGSLKYTNDRWTKS